MMDNIPRLLGKVIHYVTLIGGLLAGLLGGLSLMAIPEGLLDCIFSRECQTIGEAVVFASIAFGIAFIGIHIAQKFGDL